MAETHGKILKLSGSQVIELFILIICINWAFCATLNSDRRSLLTWALKSDLTHETPAMLVTLDSLADKLCLLQPGAPCSCVCVCYHITHTHVSVGRRTLDETQDTPEEAQMKRTHKDPSTHNQISPALSCFSWTFCCISAAMFTPNKIVSSLSPNRPDYGGGAGQTLCSNVRVYIYIQVFPHPLVWGFKQSHS